MMLTRGSPWVTALWDTEQATCWLGWVRRGRELGNSSIWPTGLLLDPESTTHHRSTVSLWPSQQWRYSKGTLRLPLLSVYWDKVFKFSWLFTFSLIFLRAEFTPDFELEALFRFLPVPIVCVFFFIYYCLSPTPGNSLQEQSVLLIALSMGSASHHNRFLVIWQTARCSWINETPVRENAHHAFESALKKTKQEVVGSLWLGGPFSFAGFWFMAPQPREWRLDVLKPTMWYLSQNKQVLGKKHRKRSAGQATGFRERMFTPLKRSWLMLVVPTSYKGVALPFSGWPMLTGNRRYSYAFSKTPRSETSQNRLAFCLYREDSETRSWTGFLQHCPAPAPECWDLSAKAPHHLPVPRSHSH